MRSWLHFHFCRVFFEILTTKPDANSHKIKLGFCFYRGWAMQKIVYIRASQSNPYIPLEVNKILARATVAEFASLHV